MFEMPPGAFDWSNPPKGAALLTATMSGKVRAMLDEVARTQEHETREAMCKGYQLHELEWLREIEDGKNETRTLRSKTNGRLFACIGIYGPTVSKDHRFDELHMTALRRA